MDHPDIIHIYRTDYEDLKKKAEKWDEINVSKPGYKQYIERLEEKARLWDSSLVDEWKDKAKKWDAHQKIWETDLHISEERLKTLEEKAKKWDDYYNTDVRMWEELKRKIHDLEQFQHHILGGQSREKAQEIRDKAKKYDALNVAFRGIILELDRQD